MLTKLLPEQVAKFWPIVKYAIEESLPPTVGEHPDKMNRILAACLDGDLEVWASYTRGEQEVMFEGIVVTLIAYDRASNTKSLLIYCLYGYENVNLSSWNEGIEALYKYARSKECSRIVGYTSVPFIIKKVRELGGEADYTFISFPVK
jgi:hypothetical protein